MNDYRSGNVAYDLTLFDPMRNQFASAQVRARVKNSSMVKARKTAVVNIILALVVTIMCVTWLACYSRYNEVNTQVSRARSEYMQLIEEKERLDLKFDRKYDLRQIEQTAVNELGMTRVKSSDVTYINSMSGDKTEVIAQNGNFAATLMRKLFGK